MTIEKITMKMTSLWPTETTAHQLALSPYLHCSITPAASSPGMKTKRAAATVGVYTVFHKNNPFSFFNNSLKWWSIYMKFSLVVAEEILIQSISTKYDSWLNIFLSWPNADVIMCHGFKFSSLNWCCLLLPCSVVNLIWFADEKCSSCQHKATGDMKSGILRFKNLAFSQAHCATKLSCSNMWKSNYLHRHINAIALHIFLWSQL